MSQCPIIHPCLWKIRPYDKLQFKGGLNCTVKSSAFTESGSDGVFVFTDFGKLHIGSQAGDSSISSIIKNKPYTLV